MVTLRGDVVHEVRGGRARRRVDGLYVRRVAGRDRYYRGSHWFVIAGRSGRAARRRPRSRCTNNLKQLTLGMLNYENLAKAMPANWGVVTSARAAQ